VLGHVYLELELIHANVLFPNSRLRKRL
jgi:hypothetical protein